MNIVRLQDIEFDASYDLSFHASPTFRDFQRVCVNVFSFTHFFKIQTHLKRNDP
jgi:hypothetical protein